MYLCSFATFAQESNTVETKKSPKYGLYLGISGQLPDLSDLNASLVRSELAPLDLGAVGVSVGYTGRNADQNSYASFELSYLGTTDNYLNPNLKSKLEIWQFSITGHYDVITNKNWLLYPYLSLGLNGARLTVSQIYGDSTFTSSLSNLYDPEVEQKKYYAAAPIFGELGLGVERKITLPGVDFFIGVSGGYNLSPTAYWGLENLKYYSDNPGFSTTGWSFEVIYRFEVNNVKPKKESWNLYRFFK